MCNDTLFILENEGYDREYFSGFVGKINMENEVELYVRQAVGN